MTRFSFVFEHFELAQRWCQVLSCDIAFSDDAQVLHLYQWLFLALHGAVTGGLFCARTSIMHHAIFVKTSHLTRAIYKSIARF